MAVTVVDAEDLVAAAVDVEVVIAVDAADLAAVEVAEVRSIILRLLYEAPVHPY